MIYLSLPFDHTRRYVTPTESGEILKFSYRLGNLPPWFPTTMVVGLVRVLHLPSPIRLALCRVPSVPLLASSQEACLKYDLQNTQIWYSRAFFLTSPKVESWNTDSSKDRHNILVVILPYRSTYVSQSVALCCFKTHSRCTAVINE